MRVKGSDGRGCVLSGQTNRVVRGAAALFRHLEAVSLRRAARLDDGALVCLARACGPRLKVCAPMGIPCLLMSPVQRMVQGQHMCACTGTLLRW